MVLVDGSYPRLILTAAAAPSINWKQSQSHNLLPSSSTSNTRNELLLLIQARPDSSLYYYMCLCNGYFFFFFFFFLFDYYCRLPCSVCLPCTVYSLGALGWWSSLCAILYIYTYNTSQLICQALSSHNIIISNTSTFGDIENCSREMSLIKKRIKRRKTSTT